MSRVLSIILLWIVVASPALARAAPMQVFVSILPQKFLVERVGGERVSVSVMVRPGLSPETYEPTPKQMAALENARLYFRINVPFESVWIDRLRSINPDMQVVSCCGSIPVFERGSHNHDHAVEDAHIWTSPENAIVLAGIIRDALIATDPGSRNYYTTNYRALVNELENLHAEIRRELADLPHRYLIVSHPSWGHYAETYDLEQVPIEQHGSEIRAKELARLVNLAREKNIRTVYVQKQFNPASAEVLAREINGRIIELDPLAENYIENLRQVTQAIREGAQS